MNNTIYLKDSNPTAFHQIQKLWHKSGIIAFPLEKLGSGDTDCLAEWKCTEGHIWISEVACRKDKSNDMECTICKNHRLNLNPRLMSHYIHESTYRNIMMSKWYCKECHQVFMSKHENIPNYDAHLLHTCVPDDTPVLSIAYPELGDEWSDKNILKADEIDEYYQDEVLWICKKCNGEWPSTIRKRIFGKTQCPFCSNKYPTNGVDTLFDKHPEKMKEWSYRLNTKLNPLLLKEDSSDFAFWDCNECGLSYAQSVNIRMQSENSCCPHCVNLDITKAETALIYSEYVTSKCNEAYNYDFFLNPENKVPRDWRCKECDYIWRASAYDRFYTKEKCPYCSGKYAIPGRTSFKALYPEIVENNWNYRNNCYICNPDEILPDSSQKVWFQCHVCQQSNHMSIHKYVLNF